MKYLGTLIVVLGLLQASPRECDLPEEEVTYLKDTLAWSDSWYNTHYLGSGPLEFNVVHRNARVFWYLVREKTLFDIDCHSDKEDWYSMMTCTQTEWPKCLEEILPGTSESETADFRRLLLGLPSSTGSQKEELKPSEICRLVLEDRTIRRWIPSPDSPGKRLAVAAMAAEVKRQVSYSGTFIKAACNDFNLNDPEIFAVAKFVDKDRQIGHLFIYLMFNGRVNKCATKHIDTEDLPEDLIQKLSRLSISLE